MTALKWAVGAATSAIFLAGAIVASAQEKFPLKPGEWERNMKLAGTPRPGGPVLLYCLNDALWMKALTQSPGCTIQTLNASTTGKSMSVSCKTPERQIKGKVELSYEGMEHMSEKSAFQVTTGGATESMEILTDWRWKGSSCSPTDINMGAGPGAPPARH